jgi:hypothetical protein
MDSEMAKWFPDSKMLSFSPKVTISHVWTTHGMKMIPIKFWVKGQVYFTLI